MRITRYFQSCLLIEEEGVRLLIDPSGHEADNFEAFGKLDAVIYTHEHGDHFDAGLAQKFQDSGVSIYANAGTARQMKTQPSIVTDGQEFEVKGVKVKTLELPHCLMWNGSEGPQNTGYLVAGKLFHPGDGKELAGLNVEILALPINGPDISLKDALGFAKQIGAKKFIPIHYDYLGGNPNVFVDVAKGMSLEGHVLDKGQSIEL